ncbi:MAG: hypothetical protein EZS28_021068 [Streblomastix strix]|uniref:Uncharacterized protein n=1 Tax=Streblomastix strix TaxID=222440 RepID=A0A5J4VLR8_9EUKA|nr:MAG: hypothetical protein EZS28_021068 [Streblomastix strix]
MNLYDVRSGLLSSSIHTHQNPVKAISFNQEGEYLASGDSDGVLLVWRVNLKEGHINPADDLQYRNISQNQNKDKLYRESGIIDLSFFMQSHNIGDNKKREKKQQVQNNERKEVKMLKQKKKDLGRNNDVIEKKKEQQEDTNDDEDDEVGSEDINDEEEKKDNIHVKEKRNSLYKRVEIQDKVMEGIIQQQDKYCRVLRYKQSFRHVYYMRRRVRVQVPTWPSKKLAYFNQGQGLSHTGPSKSSITFQSNQIDAQPEQQSISTQTKVTSEPKIMIEPPVTQATVTQVRKVLTPFESEDLKDVKISGDIYTPTEENENYCTILFDPIIDKGIVELEVLNVKDLQGVGIADESVRYGRNEYPDIRGWDKIVYYSHYGVIWHIGSWIKRNSKFSDGCRIGMEVCLIEMN